jgi:plastocyanin
MRRLTPTLSICALAAAFTVGALTAAPAKTAPIPAAATAVSAVSTAPSATEIATALITIDNFAFSAATAQPGATITIVNNDTAPHTVTANDGSFSVSVGAGETASFPAPTQPGVYEFFCEIHTSMSGVLTVT